MNVQFVSVGLLSQLAIPAPEPALLYVNMQFVTMGLLKELRMPPPVLSLSVPRQLVIVNPSISVDMLLLQ
jgi:hypothetical protein